MSELRELDMRPALRHALDLLWHRQAQLARLARTEQRTEAVRSAAAAAWRTVEELTALDPDDSKRQALRRAAKRSIPLA